MAWASSPWAGETWAGSSAAGGSATNLTIQEATHSHTADSLTTTVASTLAIQDATHAHTADNLSLSVTGVTDLTIADATHGHAADNLDLTVDGSTDLVIDDATHAHTADSLTITAEGEATTIGRKGRRTRLRKLLDFDVPMPAEVITGTVPSDKVVEPIAQPKAEPSASKLASRPSKGKKAKPAALAVVEAKPAATVEPRPMMLSDILSAETMTPEEMVAAIKLIARVQLGPQLIRSTPKAKLIRT